MSCINTIIKGERLNIYLGGDIYCDIASQLVLVVYLSLTDTTNRIIFTKNPDEKYPNAGTILPSDNPDYSLMIKLEPEMTLNLSTGKYKAELKQVIDTSEKVLKSTNNFIILKSTVTD